MRRATVVWSSWAAAAVLSLAGSAFAEPSAADKETARRLMSEGRAQRDAKDLAAALQSFQAADALMHVPTTALEVARTQIALGKLVEAHDKLLAMDRIPATPDEPRPFVEARAAAETLGNDVEARIPTLKITILGLSAGATPTVLVDGTEIPPAALMAKRAIDPGHHVVTANVEGGAPQTAEVDLAEKENKELSIDLAATPSSTPQETDAPPSEPRTNHVVSFVGFGVGAAGIITGSVTGLLAISSFNSAKSKGCVNSRCPPAAYGDLDTANAMATTSDVAFIVGGIGVAVGIVGLFVWNKDKDPGETQPSALVVRPWLGPGSGGIRGTF
jgi:hypothetical protein